MCQGCTIVLGNFLKSKCRLTLHCQSSHSICRSSQVGESRQEWKTEGICADIRVLDLLRSHWSQRLKNRYAKIYLFLGFKDISANSDLNLINLNVTEGLCLLLLLTAPNKIVFQPVFNHLP